MEFSRQVQYWVIGKSPAPHYLWNTGAKRANLRLSSVSLLLVLREVTLPRRSPMPSAAKSNRLSLLDIWQGCLLPASLTTTFHWLSSCFSGHFYQPPFVRCPWNTGASQHVDLSVLFPAYMLLQNDLFEFILNHRWNVSALCALKTKSLPGSWPAYPTSCGTSQRCPTASKPTGPKLSSSSSHKPVLPEVCSISEKGTTNVPPAKAKPRTHWCLRFLPSPALHLVTHQVLLFPWQATVHGGHKESDTTERLTYTHEVLVVLPSSMSAVGPHLSPAPVAALGDVTHILASKVTAAASPIAPCPPFTLLQPCLTQQAPE